MPSYSYHATVTPNTRSRQWQVEKHVMHV